MTDEERGDLLLGFQATRSVIKASGGHETASMISGRSVASLHNYHNPQMPDVSMPLHVAWKLQRFSGDMSIAAWMGQGCHQMPPPEPLNLMGGVVDAASHCADWTEAADAALADGKVTYTEAQYLANIVLKQLAKLEKLHRSLAHHQAQRGGDG